MSTPSACLITAVTFQALLLLLYGTGMRLGEALGLCIADVDLAENLIRIRATKFYKTRLVASTARELKQLTRGQADDQRVSLSRYGKPLSRFGIHDIVTRHVLKLLAQHSELRKKRIGPHTIRHTTATHLLRAGVDINTIRAWLGYVSIETTNVYAEIDLEMKAKALKMCEAKRRQKRWRDNPDLLAFLAKL